MVPFRSSNESGYFVNGGRPDNFQMPFAFGYDDNDFVPVHAACSLFIVPV